MDSYRSQRQRLLGLDPDLLIGLVLLNQGLLLPGELVNLHLHLLRRSFGRGGLGRV